MEVITRRRVIDQEARERAYERQRLHIFKARKSYLDEEVEVGTIDSPDWNRLNPSEKDYRVWEAHHRVEVYMAEKKVRNPAAVDERKQLKGALESLLWSAAHALLQDFARDWHARDNTVLAPVTHNPTREDIRAALGSHLASYYTPFFDNQDPDDEDDMRADRARVKEEAATARKTIEQYELGTLPPCPKREKPKKPTRSKKTLTSNPPKSETSATQVESHPEVTSSTPVDAPATTPVREVHPEEKAAGNASATYPDPTPSQPPTPPRDWRDSHGHCAVI